MASHECGVGTWIAIRGIGNLNNFSFGEVVETERDVTVEPAIYGCE